MSTVSALDTIVERLTFRPETRLSVGVRQAARLVGVSEWTLRRMCMADQLAYRRIRGRIVIPMHALEALLQRNP